MKKEEIQDEDFEETEEETNEVTQKVVPDKKIKVSLNDFITRAREGKKRKFDQTWDLIISLKNMDMKKPENRFSFDFQLPAGRGKKTKIAFIGDALYNDAKDIADVIISKAEIEKYGKDRKALKKLANECDTFMAEAPLMPLVGKSLGIVLGTRGKMPIPVSPKIKVEGVITAARNYVRVTLRNSPVVQVPIGSEKMSVEEIEKNFEAVVNAVKERLPKGVNNIRTTYIKLTMGKAIKVEI